MPVIPSPFGNSPTGAAGGGLGGTYPNPTLGNGISWQPSDNGLLAATSTLDGAGGATAALVAGTVYLMKCFIRQAFTWTTVNYIVTTAGSGASSGTFVGLYNSAGTLLSGSADAAANFSSTGALSTALTTPQSLAAGTFVWVTFLTNLATTQPAFRAEATPAFATVNAFLSNALSRAATNGTLQTTLPASITPSANAQTGTVIWAGAS